MRRSRTKTRINRRDWLLLAIVVASTALLAGCAAISSGAENAMAPGMSMPGTSVSPIPQTSSAGSAAAAPSAASQMICGTETRDNITRALALAEPPHSVDSWINRQYTCIYHLTDGEFVISVEESSDAASARSYFDTMQGNLASVQPIEGLANLGFPAYETADGVVVFLKDNMTLQVDARKLTDMIGPHGIARTAFSYEIATTILACWTEH
ncbi:MULTISPECIES: hypothetical protein [Cryobacterium]|uniref:hypothetical protein n=1 Tax=Cryobacterium TaxID=69578 RepID=UPI001056E87C|nr:MULTISPECIES: hypothetical protein [Cryobacterium]TFC41986.1 hypothetical protein E3O57_16425 [Cryobacterium sp. TMN-39-2]